MYDGLTGRYTFACPARGDVGVRLSRFRSLQRMAGPSHPSVYRVVFACPCGGEHDALVSHDELDWAPLGAVAVAFFNVVTNRLEPAGEELLEHAAHRIARGAWPWSFFCFPENRLRPVFPSAFRLMAPAGRRVAVAVRCPHCSGTSVNIVSRLHLDEPFHNDSRVDVVPHVFTGDRDALVTAFREELDSGAFDQRRGEL